MKKILYLILIIILYSNLYSQRFDFYEFPYGGEATNIQEAPDGSLYIGSYGLYKSTNNGDEWKKISDKRFYKLYFLKDNIMLGLVSADSIYYSQDSGVTWKFHSYFPFNLSVKANDEKVYFTNGEFYVLDSISRPLRKVKTISKTSIEIGEYTYEKRFYIPNFWEFSDGSMVIRCATRDSNYSYPSILYSKDKINWDIVYKRTKYSEPEINGMIKTNKNFIIYGTPGILLSTDSGIKFDTVKYAKNILEIFNYESILIAYSASEIYKSTDEGFTWQYLSNLPKSMTTNRLVCTSNGTFFAVTNIGIYRSTDQGITWKDCYQGYNCTSFSGFGFSGDIVIAGGIDLYRSFNKGTTWEKNKIDLHGFSNFQTDNKNNSYCLQRNIGSFVKPSKLLKSSNGGGDWIVLFDSASIVLNGKQESYFAEDYIVINDGQILINVASSNGRHLQVYGNYYTSTGFNWNIFGTLNFDKLYKNSDNEIFAKTDYRLYKFNQYGSSWDSLPILRGDYSSDLDLLFHPRKKFGFAHGYFNYITEDNGKTWETISISRYTKLIGWDSKDNLYAFNTDTYKDQYKYIYVSNDLGKSFTVFDTTLRSAWGYPNFFISPDDELYITSYPGYYKSRGPISDVENIDNVLVNDQDLLLYPNPASSEIYLTGKSDIKPEIIGIYDYTGRNYLIKDQIIQKNENLIKVNITGLNNGLYYCIIRINDMTQIKPFIVSR